MTVAVLCAGCFTVGALAGFLLGRYFRPRGGRHRGVQLRRP